MKKTSLALIAAMSMLGSVAVQADDNAGKASGSGSGAGAAGAITAGGVGVVAVGAGIAASSSGGDGTPLTVGSVTATTF
ncbi:hypothetical protein [Shewanella acanthi]|uniref:hypothetical protein n=1 Tax=Shewanella acanthi TaxID=2864212 RepID=UPI001C65BD28|nr:hypothetical protein [Shewanella acanthi]QYJ79946.1 hypothetical protein K0H61_05900 [Shewanella acanthi]